MLSLLTDANGSKKRFPLPSLKKWDLFFSNEWTVTTVIDGYLQYVAENFQWLYNEYGRVGYINLTDDHRNLMIVQGA